MIERLANLPTLSLLLLTFALSTSSCTSQKSGCGSDNDCKGDRICNAGLCTDPSTAAAPKPKPVEPQAETPTAPVAQPTPKRTTKTDGPPVPPPTPRAAPRLGAKQPLVVITEFGDFECAFCRRSTAIIRHLIQAHGKTDGSLAYEWRNHPLTSHSHANAMAAAAAAAHQQGQFWQMHDQLFANAKTGKKPDLEAYAKRTKLDLRTWQSHREDARILDAIAAERKVALTLGAKGTPAFFINGRLLLGFQTQKALEKAIAEEIVKAEALLKEGTERAHVSTALEMKNNAAFATALRSAPQPTKKSKD